MKEKKMGKLKGWDKICRGAGAVFLFVIIFFNAIGFAAQENLKFLGLRGILINKAAVHPQNPKMIFVNGTTSWGRENYMTEDGGQKWRSLKIGNNHMCDFFFHPDDSRILFIGNKGGVYRSLDCGETWNVLTNIGLYPLVFSPTQPRVIYAGAHTGFDWYRRVNLPIIYSSPDCGETWHPVAYFYTSQVSGTHISSFNLEESHTLDVQHLLIDPGDPASLFAYVYIYHHFNPGGPGDYPEGYTFSSRNWGGSWEQVPYPIKNKRVSPPSFTSMWIAYQPFQCIMALVGREIERSLDSGKSYETIYTFQLPGFGSMLFSSVPLAGYYANTSYGLYFSDSLDSEWRHIGMKGKNIYSLCENKAGGSLLVGTDDGLYAVSGLPLPDPPQIEIQSPAPGTTVYGEVTVKALATDAAEIVRSGLQVDGKDVAEVEGNHSNRQEISFKWDTRNHSAGSHSLKTWSENGANLRGFSQCLFTNVENVLIQISGQRVWDRAWILRRIRKTDYVDVTVTVENPGGIKNLNFNVSSLWDTKKFIASELKYGRYTCRLKVPNNFDRVNFFVRAWTDNPYIQHAWKSSSLELH